MDIRDLAFDSGAFDVAIDKGRKDKSPRPHTSDSASSGTMDAMMTAKGDVWVSTYRLSVRHPVDRPPNRIPQKR